MMDIQKERLKHLLASAILDLWKKETGSHLSVMIEGTICITCSTGKMTVIQMCNQFPGSVFQDQMSTSIEDFSGPTSRKRRYIDYSRSKSFYGNNERLSSQNLQEMLALVKDGNNNNTHDAGVFKDEDDEEDDDDDIEDGVLQIKEESSSEENDDLEGCVTDGDLSTSVTAPAIESFYLNGDGKKDGDISEINDSAIQDMTGESGNHDETAMQASSPRGDLGAQSSGKSDTCSVSQSKEVNAEDLSSHHDPDLAISPPQSYTAQVQDAIQVRNTIRQQLLAKEPKMTHDGSEPMKSPPPRSSMISDRIRLPSDLPVMKFMSPIQAWPVKQENGNISDGRLPHHSTPIFNPFLTEQSKNLLESLRNPAHNNIQDIIRLKNLNMAGLGSQDDAPKCSYSSPIYPFREMSSDSMKSEPPSSDPSGQNGVEQKVYKCNFCQKTFLFKSKYHEHLPVHTSARPFECHLCLRTYKYKYDLRVHLRTHLGIPTKSTICPFCSNKFLTNKLLRQHIREAHEEQQRISDEQCAQSLEKINSAA